LQSMRCFFFWLPCSCWYDVREKKKNDIAKPRSSIAASAAIGIKVAVCRR
jgi:hypothetical protein